MTAKQALYIFKTFNELSLARLHNISMMLASLIKLTLQMTKLKTERLSHFSEVTRNVGGISQIRIPVSCISFHRGTHETVLPLWK